MTEETDKLIEQRLKHLEEQIDILIKMHKPKEDKNKIDMDELFKCKVCVYCGKEFDDLMKHYKEEHEEESKNALQSYEERF